MALYEPPSVITDPAILKANAEAVMESRLPGWRSTAGSVEDILFDAFSFAAADQGIVLLERLDNVYRGLGQLIATTPLEPLPATGVATVTVKDTAGYTIAANELVIGLYSPEGELISFRNGAALTIAPGASSGTVTVTADEPGTVGNSLTGVATLISAPTYVTTVSLGTTGGGQEAETDSEYLDRLTEALATQKPGPVLAADAATIARSIAGIGRAVAVDLLKPASTEPEAYPTPSGAESTTTEKAVTVAVVKADGTDVPLAEREALQKSLAAKREPNFQFYVVKPHRWEIIVEAAVFAWPGESTATVKAAVEAALKNFLSPATWATDPTGNAERWTNDPWVRRSELYTAIMSVPGVRYVTTLKLAKKGAALGEVDIQIEPSSAIPALPEASTLTVSVTATT